MTAQKKISLKTISFVLVLSLVLTCFPFNGLAGLSASAQSEEITIVCEVEELRDRYSKTYLKSDNSYTCISSPVALHTWDEEQNKWLDIDNSLTSRLGQIKNGDADLSVTLPEYVSQANAITIADKDEELSLSMKLEGISHAKAKQASKMKKSLSAKSMENMSSKELLDAATTAGTVTYTGVLPDTDIRYDLMGDALKENIIIKKRPNKAVSYTYQVTVKGLMGVLNDDYSVSFYETKTYDSSKDQEAAFTIPPAVMIDAKGVQSDDIKVTLTEQDGGYRLTYTPNFGWLHDASRDYPVAVDPTIQGNQSNIKSGYICVDSQSYTKDTTGETLSVGRYGRDCYTYIKQAQLPSIPAGAVVTKASLNLCQESVSPLPATKRFVSSAHTATEDFEALTAQRAPNYDSSSALDWAEHTNDTNGTFLSYDITAAAVRWFDQSRSNYGICLKSSDSVYQNAGYGVKLFSVNVTEPLLKPYFEFEYRDYSQVEGKSVRTLDIGRAGTVVVSDLTGNLKLERRDAGIDGNVAPAAISMLFNNRDVRRAVLEGGTTGNVYGAGFRTNYNQTLEHQYGSSATKAKERYEYRLGDGSVIHFERQIEDKDVTGDTDPETIFTDTSGSGYKLHMIVYSQGDGSVYYPTSITSGMYVVDKNKQRHYFDSSGRLIKVVPYSPQTAEHVTAYSTPESGKSFEPGVIRIKYESENRTNLKIDKITDGAGRVYQFNYTTPSANNTQLNNISSVIDGVTKKLVEYTYQSRTNASSYNLLPLSAKYADGKTVTYTWDSSNMSLETIKDTDGYYMKFYYNTPANNHRKVSQIFEYGSDGTAGQNVRITYGNSWTSYQNVSSCEEEKIFFDPEGNILMTQDADGRSVYGKYDKKKDENGNERNRIVSMSAVHRTVPSLLQRPITSSGTSRWTLSNASVSTENMYLNKYGFKLAGNAKIEAPSQISLNADGYYTYSAYVKTQNAVNAHLCLRTPVGGYALSKKLNGTNDYVRLSCKVNVDIRYGTTVLPQIISEGGTVWVDAIQLEPGDRSGETHEAYNLVNNSGFWQGMTDWEKSSNAVTGSNEDAVSSSPALGVKVTENPNIVDAWNYLWIQGQVDRETKVKQTIPISNGKKGDQYTFGAWGKLFVTGSHPGSAYQVRVRAIRASGVNTSDFPFDKEYKATFNPAVSEWQYVLGDFTAEYDYTALEVSFVNQKQCCKAYFDGAQLYRTTFGQNLVYDSSGNLVGSQDILQTEQHPEDIEKPDLDNPTTSKEKTTEDKYGRVTEAVSAEGVGATQNYDKFNNPLISRVTNGRVSMEKKNAYTADGNYQTSASDESGNKVTYQYNRQTGNLDRVTDAKGWQTNYTYNEAGKVSGISKAVSGLSGASTMNTSYTYDAGDRLKTISHNGFQYNIDHTPFGETSKVSVGSQTLAQYAFSNSATDRMLKKITFGNGQSIAYNYSTYDQGKHVQKISDINGKYFFKYDSSGILKRVEDRENSLTTTYAVDSKGDTVAETVRSGGSRYYTYSQKSSEKNDTVLYDKLPNNGEQRNIHYVVDKDGRSNGVWWDNINQDYRSASEIFYDDLGRRTSSVLYKGMIDSDGKLCDRNTTLLNTTYSYRDLPQYKTSKRITGINLQGAGSSGSYFKQLSYAYDSNGNITHDGDISYSYDKANQLVRVNDPAHGTKTYTYDAGGNIVSVNEYTYTTGILGSPTKTNTYGYDPVWKDKLSAYNGNSIARDAIGNPVRYHNGWEFTWQNGQQLASVRQDNVTTVYKYDEQGRRLSKKSTDGSTVDVEYTYADGLLTSLNDKRNGKFYCFYYDSDGQIVSCAEYAGGGTYKYFYYVRNLQGDVIAILDDSGKALVEYQYDAWGKVLSKTHDGSVEGYNLSAHNPFLYRGYQYDKETGFYYLRNRYYDPALGRFLNADSQINNGPVKLNLFAYADNNPINAVDSQGTDAIWLQDSDTVPVAGHSGALIQDGNGVWYHFYWGNNGNRTDSSFTSGKGMGRSILVAYKYANKFRREDSVESINWRLNNHKYTVKVTDKDGNSTEEKRPIYVGKYEAAIYFEGDFSGSVKYAMKLEEAVKQGDIGYNLVFKNCVQVTMDVLSHGDWGFINKLNHFITPFAPVPNIDYGVYALTNLGGIMKAEEEFDITTQTIRDLEAKGLSRTQMAYQLSKGL